MDAVERNGLSGPATYGGGLNRIIRSPLGNYNITHYRESNGLINDNLYVSYRTVDGNLWMSSNKGLSRFDPTHRTIRELSPCTTDFRRMNSIIMRSSDSSGVMLFGGISGFVEFDPAEIGMNTSSRRSHHRTADL
jgi:ligand-binding sensor domain-containing protein